MNTELLLINPNAEKEKIITFFKKTFIEQGITKAVIGLSGGIDSTVSFYLLRQVLAPEHIIVAHLYQSKPAFSLWDEVLNEAKIPEQNRHLLSIQKPVDTVVEITHAELDKFRIGNIAARMRMVVLFDLAKQVNGLVCGTENKSENLLGYFTRFGDQASDIEPIEHLYKTQIYQLAKHLAIPSEIISQHPTAGLWTNQTDEGEFGFSYEEADQVLYLHLEKNVTIAALMNQGFTNAEKIIAWRAKNLFKHQVPYTI